MLRSGVIAILIFTTSVVSGQTDFLGQIWNASESSYAVVDQKISSVFQSGAKYLEKSDLDYLHFLFQKTQKQFLKTYSPYVGLEELTKGRYDCLTATTLFAAILKEAGYKFRIVETNYHIFLVVETSQGDVLLETTDRFDGFVTDKGQIQQRIEAYQKNLTASSSKEKSHQYTFSLYREVQPVQLKGLLYFNQAVRAFNSRDWLRCAYQLQLAREHYETPRIAELAALLLQTISFSDLTDQQKESIRTQFKEYENYLGFPIASR